MDEAVSLLCDKSTRKKIAGLKSSKESSSAELTLVALCLLAPAEIRWVKRV